MKDLRDLGKISISEITYHVMMNVYGRRGNIDGAIRAEELLRSMEKEGLSPNSISYNILIDAYARCGVRGESGNKAESLLQEMISLSNHGKEECRPTIHSFASVVSFR